MVVDPVGARPLHPPPPQPGLPRPTPTRTPTATALPTHVHRPGLPVQLPRHQYPAANKYTYSYCNVYPTSDTDSSHANQYGHCYANSLPTWTSSPHRQTATATPVPATATSAYTAHPSYHSLHPVPRTPLPHLLRPTTPPLQPQCQPPLLIPHTHLPPATSMCHPQLPLQPPLLHPTADLDFQSNRKCYGDHHPHPHPHADQNPHSDHDPHADQNPHAHPHGDSLPHPNGYAHPDGLPHGHRHTNPTRTQPSC